MRNAQVMYALIGALLFGVSTASAENWHDPSPHLIRFVTVQPGVKIETLDWGGAGRPVILIAGAGGTAHAFDDFALLLTPRFEHFTSDAPNGRLVILQGANHMLFASNPQDVLRETLNFADSLPP